MADYRETPVSGTSWQRCGAMSFAYPYQGAPSVVVCEEVVTSLGETFSVTPAGQMVVPVTEADMNQEVQLVDPQTGESIAGATMTYAQIYITLYSLYYHLAQKRDEAAAAPPAVPNDEPEFAEQVEEPEP